MGSWKLSVGLAAVLMVLFGFVGPAAAVPVTGSVNDDQDATPELLPNGSVRDNPDLKRVTVSYDAPSGRIDVGVELWRAVAYDGAWQYGALSLTLGSRYNATGDCVADTAGDPTVYVYFSRYNSWPWYADLSTSASFRDYGGNTVQGRVTTADWVSFTAGIAADPSKNRAYKCVRDVRLDSSGADEARGFCLGSCPQPPAGGDRAAPTVRWVAPRDGQTISGIYSENPGSRSGWHTCQVEARDDVAVDRTENLVDGVFHDSQISPPYSCEWDTREVPDGRHTLTVVAYDRAGKSARSTIAVTVRNQSVPPPAAGASPPPAPPSSPSTPDPGSPPAGPQPPAPPSPASGVLGADASFGGRILGARTLEAFAREGLRVRVRCPAACRAGVRLTVARRVARRLGTGTTLARGARRLQAAGRTVIRLRPSREVARRLLGRSRLRATVLVRATQAGGVEQRLRRRVTLGP